MDQIAFVFSGQGAQHPGMGEDFYQNNERARALFDEAETIRPGVTELCFHGDAAALKQTENTQPCLYLADLAAAIALQDAGIQPKALAGFSLGEIPALAFGGAFDFAEGFRITCKRGELMAQASAKQQTSMLAVLKMKNEAVEEICSRYEHVYPVNYNSPGQLVVSGLSEELEQAKADFTAAGGRVVPLAVSGAFHSPFMDDAASGLGEFLRPMTLNKPLTTVYSNFTASPYENDVAARMEQQINHPVRWEEIIRSMCSAGITTFIETGVGNTLQKLITKIAPECRAFRAETMADVAAIVKEVQ